MNQKGFFSRPFVSDRQLSIRERATPSKQPKEIFSFRKPKKFYTEKNLLTGTLGWSKATKSTILGLLAMGKSYREQLDGFVVDVEPQSLTNLNRIQPGGAGPLLSPLVPFSDCQIWIFLTKQVLISQWDYNPDLFGSLVRRSVTWPLATSPWADNRFKKILNVVVIATTTESKPFARNFTIPGNVAYTPIFCPFPVCKRKEEEPPQSQTKKPRLVFTDLQRRTLQAIFKVTYRNTV